MFPDYVDAVEVINTHNKSNELNKLALEYAEKYNLIKFCGSDCHSINPQDGGLAFLKKPKSINDVIDMARKRECVLLGEEKYLI